VQLDLAIEKEGESSTERRWNRIMSQIGIISYELVSKLIVPTLEFVEM
jgi:hypothetical protein